MSWKNTTCSAFGKNSMKDGLFNSQGIQFPEGSETRMKIRQSANDKIKNVDQSGLPFLTKNKMSVWGKVVNRNSWLDRPWGGASDDATTDLVRRKEGGRSPSRTIENLREKN